MFKIQRSGIVVNSYVAVFDGSTVCRKRASVHSVGIIVIEKHVYGIISVTELVTALNYVRRERFELNRETNSSHSERALNGVRVEFKSFIGVCRVGSYASVFSRRNFFSALEKFTCGRINGFLGSVYLYGNVYRESFAPKSNGYGNRSFARLQSGDFFARDSDNFSVFGGIRNRIRVFGKSRSAYFERRVYSNGFKLAKLNVACFDDGAFCRVFGYRYGELNRYAVCRCNDVSRARLYTDSFVVLHKENLFVIGS